MPKQSNTLQAPPDPPITFTLVKILNVLRKNDQVAGSDIISLAGLHSGTVYPALQRLLASLWVKTEQEKGTAQQLGRPVKTFFSLTPHGKQKVNILWRELQQIIN